MGLPYFLLLLIYLDPLNLLSNCEVGTRTKSNKNLGASIRPGNHPKGKDVNNTAVPAVAVTRKVKPPSIVTYETCMGYYDVSGQWDKEFNCNNTAYRYCCGTCSYRFCCDTKSRRLDQNACKMIFWNVTTRPNVVDPEATHDPEKHKTNTTVYITCGVITFIIIAGVFAKVAYDKAKRPPREMNIHSL
ncbi:protein shisa-6-like [Rhinatrema bivittatum]|uniref:protein shisa-6-like n=1 Tax=Rhinatrema bivittatum TaxID=194408 RepID=UPI00112D5037|nr:protein shisa-6-like [Rhinatrema bivittatum]